MARPTFGMNARPLPAPVPVQPVATGDDWMHPRPLITDSRGYVLRASSASAAVDLCRAAGLRVLCTGGLVDTVDDDDVSRWIVTVHPE